MVMTEKEVNDYQLVKEICEKDITDIRKLIQDVKKKGYEILKIESLYFLFPISIQKNRYMLIKEKGIEISGSIISLYKNKVYKVDAAYIFHEIELNDYTILMVDIDLKKQRAHHTLKFTKELIVYQNLNYLLLPIFQLLSLKKVLKNCIEYSRNRTTFGVPIHKHQMVAQILAEGFTEYSLNKLYLIDLIEKLNKELVNLKDYIEYIKLIMESQQKMLDQIIPVTGAHGLLAESEVNKDFLEIHITGSVFRYVNYILD
ncbi:acyl-CoA dehydrogenase family protein [Bacillus cereus]|uniref:acyl-CoA dehydrogenase family protein n=1 Tax=Bacillus cereus TaxID=1396 RepID=UPI000279A9E9|nr:acyl-CoA dehydrogenase family protein [Bacillus cereus]EJR73561.1 hypothetical protein IK9_05096 [Bacillus cereus VD166]MDZ4631606.1 acyl-CoA dehydrogenase family protein [Bacillus cereus]